MHDCKSKSKSKGFRAFSFTINAGAFLFAVRILGQAALYDITIKGKQVIKHMKGVR